MSRIDLDTYLDFIRPSEDGKTVLHLGVEVPAGGARLIAEKWARLADELDELDEDDLPLR